MQASNAPAKIPLPFANSGTKNTIPTTSQIAVTPGAASLTDGFPPLTRTPIAAGGIPPFGADMNGILFELSANIQWENAGGFYPYDATFSTAIGGYPKGAVLAKATNAGLWMSTSDNNTANPDTGGAGWVDPLAGRLLQTTIYTKVLGSTTQTVSVNGGAPSTTGATTFTAQSATTRIEIEVLGAGGGGGGTPGISADFGGAPGGGAGGYAKSSLLAASVPAGVAVTVGSGGASNTGAAGGNGGSSSVGSLLSATGGNGATLGGNNSSQAVLNGGVGGVGSSGNVLNASGGPGGSAINLLTSNSLSGSGGISVFGGGGPSVGGGTNSGGGSSTATPGSGGSGASTITGNTTALFGGLGFPGIVIIREYA